MPDTLGKPAGRCPALGGSTRVYTSFERCKIKPLMTKTRRAPSRGVHQAATGSPRGLGERGDLRNSPAHDSGGWADFMKLPHRERPRWLLRLPCHCRTRRGRRAAAEEREGGTPRSREKPRAGGRVPTPESP